MPATLRIIYLLCCVVFRSSKLQDLTDQLAECRRKEQVVQQSCSKCVQTVVAHAPFLFTPLFSTAHQVKVAPPKRLPNSSVAPLAQREAGERASARGVSARAACARAGARRQPRRATGRTRAALAGRLRCARTFTQLKYSAVVPINRLNEFVCCAVLCAAQAEQLRVEFERAALRLKELESERCALLVCTVLYELYCTPCAYAGASTIAIAFVPMYTTDTLLWVHVL